MDQHQVAKFCTDRHNRNKTVLSKVRDRLQEEGTMGAPECTRPAKLAGCRRQRQAINEIGGFTDAPRRDFGSEAPAPALMQRMKQKRSTVLTGGKRQRDDGTVSADTSEIEMLVDSTMGSIPDPKKRKEDSSIT